MLRKYIIKILIILRGALSQETELTKGMLKTYYLYMRGDVQPENLKEANAHLERLLKDLGFGFLTILPFSPVTIPFIARLCMRYDIDIIPDWFKDSLKK